MSTTLEHALTYSCSVEELHLAFLSEDYWRDLAAGVTGDYTTLTAAEINQVTATVTLTQIVPSEKLPSIVSKIIPGDVTIERVISWGSLEGGIAAGSTKAHVKDAPASIVGSSRLGANANGCSVTHTLETTVKIPLVGGRIEKTIGEHVLTLIDAERDFTEEWVTNKRQ